MASSSSSSSSATQPSSDWEAAAAAQSRSLPVMALREKIVEKIRQNRVTLIVGDTGCGKSSQVPQFLLEENMEPIVCTQPRRFAVVAIARMVAKARNCEIGEEVGYHIGHSNVSNVNSKRSRIVFKTAGVLLEQIRDKGLAALNYKVIILDEVHERSVESDLVLACVKQFMIRKKDLRVVMMSATADIMRYRDYFKDLGRGERVEVIAIPKTLQNSNFQRRVLYLEQVADLLKMRSISESLAVKYCSGVNPSADVDLKPDVYELIHKLILHIHEGEPEIEKSILVFLPTYYALEQQWIRLRSLGSLFKVHILHRSIETDQAFLAMNVLKSHRKVILATNIAESSVTIPDVAYVIDSCRSLQVFWDYNRKRESAELVWVSKSQAEQRRGRTGRTCDGHIYRLVTSAFYSSLQNHEFPAILRLSLRQQVLMICCAESKAINDPKVLLQKVLDPPDSHVVEDALDLLVHIHALEKPNFPRSRHEPTFYGRLLDSLPLSFDASMLSLKFGETGFLHEGILISILVDIQPLPIIQPFGNQQLSMQHLDNYFQESGTLSLGKSEAVFIANLCAFQFWQRVFKDKHRLERLKQIIKKDQPNAPDVSELEEEWCAFHNLVQTSLHNISEIFEDVINTMHRFRPDFLAKRNLPTYFWPRSFNHSCVLESEIPDLQKDLRALTLEDENFDLVSKSCLALPFVGKSDFQAASVAEKLQILIKEIKVQSAEGKQSHLQQAVNGVVQPAQAANGIVWPIRTAPGGVFQPAQVDTGVYGGVVHPALEAMPCKFFANGVCSKGDLCLFSHSPYAKRPACKYFLTFQGCKNGNSCSFSHDYVSVSSAVTSRSCLQEDHACPTNCFVKLLPNTDDRLVLVLNDKNLHFTSNLARHYDARKIIACIPDLNRNEPTSRLKHMRLIQNVTNPSDLIIGGGENFPVPWTKLDGVLWYSDSDFELSESSNEKFCLQNFFEKLAIRILAEKLHRLRVILTMNNTKFANLQVERLARECFFFLTETFPFDESSLGKFSDTPNSTKPMQISEPFSFVFSLHPPSDVQHGDYASALGEGLDKLRATAIM